MENKEFMYFLQIPLKTYLVDGLLKHQLFLRNIIGSRATLGPCTPQNGEICVFHDFPPKKQEFTTMLCFFTVWYHFACFYASGRPTGPKHQYLLRNINDSEAMNSTKNWVLLADYVFLCKSLFTLKSVILHFLCFPHKRWSSQRHAGTTVIPMHFHCFWAPFLAEHLPNAQKCNFPIKFRGIHQKVELAVGFQWFP